MLLYVLGVLIQYNEIWEAGCVPDVAISDLGYVLRTITYSSMRTISNWRRRKKKLEIEVQLDILNGDMHSKELFLHVYFLFPSISSTYHCNWTLGLSSDAGSQASGAGASLCPSGTTPAPGTSTRSTQDLCRNEQFPKEYWLLDAALACP